MSNVDPTRCQQTLEPVTYWLSSLRDHDGSLHEQHIRIEWDGHTACADLRDGSLRWQNGTADVPEALAALALECALDAYEYGVAGCSFQGEESANEQYIACDDAWGRRQRERASQLARRHYGQNEDHEFPEVA